MPKSQQTKEVANRQPTLEEAIDALEKYRLLLYESKAISSTRFGHMQTAIHGAKNLMRDIFGAERQPDVAWVK